MSDTTHATRAFKPATNAAGNGLLRELLEATPLYVFVMAFRDAVQASLQR